MLKRNEVDLKSLVLWPCLSYTCISLNPWIAIVLLMYWECSHLCTLAKRELNMGCKGMAI